MENNQADTLRWFCIRTQPKHEHIAAAHLRQIPGVETFCPRLRFKRKTTTGLRWFTEAMFPGYIFAKFDLVSQHRQVRSAAGVTTILRFGSFYASVEETVIENIRRQTDAQQVALIDPGFVPGDAVQIAAGALEGLAAVITEVLPGKERVRILVEFLGRAVHAELPSPAILPGA